jgi:peptide/nickel transport system substrate-binding protein
MGGRSDGSDSLIETGWADLVERGADAAWSRRRFLGGSLAVAASALGAETLLAACLNAATSTSTGAAPRKGGHVIDSGPSDVKNFNYYISADGYTWLICNMLFDSLIAFDPRGNPTPVLAAEPAKFSADSLTATFKLRQDAMWTDGQPITADDVAFTYALLIDPQYNDFNYSGRTQIKSYLDSVTATDKHTVVFKAKKQYATFAFVGSSAPILPKHVLGKLTGKELNTTDFNTNPTVTSGLFRFVKWEQGQQVTLARNESYYRGASLLDGWVFRVVPTFTAAAQALKTGEIDTAAVLPENVAEISSQPNLSVLPAGHRIVDTCCMNQDPAKPAARIFGDKSVRQALMYALDRAAIVKAVYFGQGVVPDSVILPESWAHNPSVKPQYKFDKAKAEKLLDDVGWAKDSSGMRSKNGVPLQWELLTFNQYQEHAQVLSQQWKAIGANVTPKIVSLQAELDQILNLRTFDMVMITFAPSVLDPDISAYLHSRFTVKGGINGWLYKNPKMDDLLDQGLAAVDRAKRREIYYQIQDLLADEVAVAPISIANSAYALNKRVQNYRFNPNSAYYRYALNGTWVTDGK